MSGYSLQLMRRLLIGLLLAGGSVSAADWIVAKGGRSPDKKLAVAVFPQKTQFIDEADGTVLLIDQTTGNKIGPLEEIDSTGGTWGEIATNIQCEWSADSSVLVINYRTGRLMYSFQIYRVKGHRAIPVSLPATKSHPKAKILEVLGYSANPGATVSLAEDGTIVEERYGFMPKEGHWNEDYAKYGLKDFESSLRFHYRFDPSGHLQLRDVTVPPPPK